MDHLFYLLPYWIHSKNLIFFLSTMITLPPKLLFLAFPSASIPESVFLLYSFCFYEYQGIIAHIYYLLKFFDECIKKIIVFENLKNVFLLLCFKILSHAFFGLSFHFLLAVFCVTGNYYQCCLRLGPWINRLHSQFEKMP